MEKINLVKALNFACKDPELKIKYAGLREIKETTKNDYLSRFTNIEDKEFVQSVLEKTIYIPSEEFFKSLEESFRLFSESIGDEPFYIYLPKQKFSSEHIFTIYLWEKIIHKNFIHFVNSESVIKEGTNILIIDDCIYTGNNILSAIDETTYTNKNIKINFYLVVPFVSVGGFEAISSFKMKTQLFSVKFFLIKKMEHFFSKHNRLDNSPDSRNLEQFLERFKLEFSMQVPIYFDHKVANNFSTFESIYLEGIIPGQEDYGLLISYLPDTDVKSRIYNKYFQDINFFAN